MFNILCKSCQIVVPNVGFHVGFPQNHLSFSIRLLSSHPDRSFAVSYLINSCGLSPHSANSVAKRVNFKTLDRPDSVISLLKDYDFTISHISRLINKNAKLLLFNPAKTIFPKLEFLCSIGVSRSDLPEVVCSNPDLLTRSLDNYLVPSYNVLKSILGSDVGVVMCLQRLFRYDMSKNFVKNIDYLRKIGMPQHVISHLLTRAPNVLSGDLDKFSESVYKVIELGLDPSKRLFVQALQLVSQMSQQMWDRKMEVFRNWGFSEYDIRLAIRRYPFCMFASVEKVTRIMEFLVNKMGFLPADIVTVPSIFGNSLEKRVIPRLSVVRFLQEKGLVKGTIRLSSVVTITEKQFLDTYVLKYQGAMPKVSSIYRGEISILDLGG
ncbi:Mitochondrial transcription termination factor family protein [Euphorbia peplus]|nr:Mitochondrial transcription termination factor family protein [Euphorbia peplus]